MKTKTSPKRLSKTDYKDRETLTWRGLTYRYSKHYGEWRLLDKPVPLYAPKGIMAWSRNGVTQWEVDGYRAESPLAALEGRIKALIDLRAREAREAAEHAKSLRAEVRQLRSKKWNV